MRLKNIRLIILVIVVMILLGVIGFIISKTSVESNNSGSKYIYIAIKNRCEVSTSTQDILAYNSKEECELDNIRK